MAEPPWKPGRVHPNLHRCVVRASLGVFGNVLKHVAVMAEVEYVDTDTVPVLLHLVQFASRMMASCSPRKFVEACSSLCQRVD